MPLRLLVCDDAPEARELVRTVLGTAGAIEIVGEAADGEEAVARALALRPDVVLMDVAMPRLDGVAATRQIRELLRETRIVAYAGSDDSQVVMAMIEAGADAYCLKSAPAWELERAVVGAAEPLARLAHALARCAGETVKAEVVAREAAGVGGSACAVVYLESSTRRLAAAATAGPAEPPRAARALAGRAFAGRSPVAAGRTIAIPLVADGDTYGALVVTAGEGREPDRELLASVADLAAASLAGERQLLRTQEEARTDALTGLGNRRVFDERLAERESLGGGFALVVFDVDDFKAVNDTRGHATGDEVLRRIAIVLRRSVRADEEVFRIGGEEFAVLVEGGRDTGLRVAERLCEAIRRDRRGQPLPTLSAGVATIPGDSSTREELVRRADAALYTAKWSGKDRAVAYGLRGERRAVPTGAGRRRVLVVDDDPGLRALLRTTFEPIVEVDEAPDAEEAARRVGSAPPDAIVLDVRMRGLDGLSFCRRLKTDASTAGIAVVLLTGGDAETEADARDAGADAFVRKPFRPLELVSVVESLLGSGRPLPARLAAQRGPEDQVLLYADDLRKLLEIERGQRALIQAAYRKTVSALAAALESKDTGTGLHSQRVQRYATDLASAVDERLLDDPSLEYGFLLHDVGKIGIPDRILLKPGRLTAPERRLMRTHTVLGEQILGDVALLQREGLRVVRSHHERWDGRGYPDGLAGSAIPIGARIFAVADTLDAVTSDRPYRAARPWDEAVAEVERAAGTQFDPRVVAAFLESEHELRRVHDEFAVAA